MSLQFPSLSGYFSALARRRASWLLVGVLAGCGERDRLTFPVENPGDGSGPFTNVTRPAVTDTAVTEGDLLILTGYSLDPDGVDTVYFEVSGAGQGFAPLLGEGADSVPFALQLSTLGNPGGTISVRAFAVDGLGDRGPATVRQIRIE
ncbi:MAG TPA: hypothetical protein VIG08_13635 [Gemmatimonadales bacterium]|jgi:hypothetical protein